MKRLETTEVTICDQCNTRRYVDGCFGCGRELCWECWPKYGVVYEHAVHFSGSGDGRYCRPCDRKLTDDKLHMAYVAIRDLRKESKRFWDDFEKRTDKAEAHLHKLINGKG